MSLESKIDELMGALTAHTAALGANTAVLERVVAGQAAAMEKLEAGSGKAATGTRSRKAAAAPETPPATEPAAAAPEAPATAGKEPIPDAPQTTVCGVDVTSDDALRAHIAAYLNRDTDAAARKERGGILATFLAEMGTKTFVGDEGVKDINDRRRLAFYVARAAAGLPVDFAADYDFDGDPAQGDAPAADAGDEFQIG